MAGPSTEDAKPQGNSPESLSRATQNTRKVMVSFMVECDSEDGPRTLFLESVPEGLIYPGVEPHPPEKYAVCSANRQNFSQLPSGPWTLGGLHIPPQAWGFPLGRVS